MNPEELKPVLQSALQQGFLKPTSIRCVCFVQYLNTANEMLWILKQAGETGLSTSQMCQRVDFHKNTCTTYLRFFVELGLVNREDTGQKETIWYYFDKKTKVRDIKEKVKTLLDYGVSPRFIAEEVGISLSRVYQIRDYLNLQT